MPNERGSIVGEQASLLICVVLIFATSEAALRVVHLIGRALQ